MKGNIKLRICRAIEIASIVIAGYTSINEVLKYASDAIFKIPEEIQLEKQIRKPIFLGLGERGKKRKEKIELFRHIYEQTRSHWDNFDRQFSLARRIFLYSSTPHNDNAGSVSYLGDIIL